MWSETKEFPSLEQPIVVEPISDLVDPTLLSESVPHVIEPISSLVNPILPMENDFDEAVESISVSVNPTLPLESEVSTSHIFFTAISELAEQGGTELASDQPPPIPRIASFDWDSLVEPRLPSHAPFQIKVKVDPIQLLIALLMKEPQLVFCLLVLGKVWDLPTLCRLLLSYWRLIEELV